MELALKGEPELAKDTVKCMHKVFSDPASAMEGLYSVSPSLPPSLSTKLN